MAFMESILRNGEQSLEALKDKQNKAVELKQQYADMVAKGESDPQFDSVRSQLAKLIGNNNFPMQNNWSNPDVMNAWVNADLNDSAQSDKNSEIGKLLRETDKKASNQLVEVKEDLGRALLDARKAVAIYKSTTDVLQRNRAVAELDALVGPEAADKLIKNEIDFDNPNLAGRVGELAQKVADLGNYEKAASAPETEKKGPGTRFKEFIGGIYAEAGKLVLSAKENFSKTTGNWWEKAKGMFKKKETAENIDDNEEKEFKNAFQELAYNAGKFKGETGTKIRELLAGGKEKGKELKEFLAQDSDARDQAAALGLNLLMNLFRLNPVGILAPVAMKAIMDNRAINRADGEKRLGEYVANRFQMGTNRENLSTEQTHTQESVSDELQRLQAEAQKMDDLLAEMNKKKRSIKRREKAVSKNEFKREETLGRNLDAISQLQDDVEQLNKQLSQYYDSDSFKRLLILENTDDAIDLQNEKADTKFGKFMRSLGRLGRGALDAINLPANAFKKVAIGAQENGKKIDSFIKNHTEGNDQNDQEAIFNAVDALAAKLTPAQIMDRYKTDLKGLHKDINEFRDLLAALIDLGVIGDMIPRNIGHKQINKVLNKFGLGAMAGKEGLFRNPTFVAELRKKVQEQAADVAQNLIKGKEIAWDQVRGDYKKTLEDIMKMGSKDTAQAYLAGRQREMAGRLRNADLLAIFANGAVTYAATHPEQMTEAMKNIAGSFNHETDLSRGNIGDALDNATRSNTESIGDDLNDATRSTIDDHSTGPTGEGGSTSGGRIEVTSPTSGTTPDGDMDTTGPTTSDINTDRSDAVNIGGGQNVDYTNAQGQVMLNEQGQPIGYDQQGNVTTSGGAEILNTPDNLTGDLSGRLLVDIQNANVDTDSINGLLYGYVLPLAREMNRSFSPDELLQIDALRDQGLTLQQVAQEMFDRNIQ